MINKNIKENIKKIITIVIASDGVVDEQEVLLAKKILKIENENELGFEEIKNKSEKEIDRILKIALQAIEVEEIQRTILRIVVSIIKADGKVDMGEMRVLNYVKEEYKDLNFEEIVTANQDLEALIEELNHYSESYDR